MQNVTALGPQNHFQANLLSALGVMHFTNEEIKETFDEVTAGDGSIAKQRMFELLKAAYGFEPMPEEMGLFVSTFDLEADGMLDWAEIEVGLDHIRTMLSRVSKNATEFQSHEDMQAELKKHTRMRKDPMDKYKAPMTEAQSIGWHEEEVFNERFPKTSCAETRYVDSMVKSRLDVF